MRIHASACAGLLLLFNSALLLVTASMAVAAEPETKTTTAADKAASKEDVARATSAAPATARQKCLARCEADNGLCNSEVRRGRRECSRKAASNNNNPLTGRPDDAFCGYFHGDHCGVYGNRGACSQRFVRRYAECVQWMRGNIAAQRFDCFKAETQAQGLCRAELHDCRAACP